jgi:hypothetical protein
MQSALCICAFLLIRDTNYRHSDTVFFAPHAFTRLALTVPHATSSAACCHCMEKVGSRLTEMPSRVISPGHTMCNLSDNKLFYQIPGMASQPQRQSTNDLTDP